MAYTPNEAQTEEERLQKRVQAMLLPFSEKAFFRDGIVHVSSKAREDPAIGDLLFFVEEEGLGLVWHDAVAFAEYHLRDATQTRMQENELQRYVVELFAKACSRRAQDIHIIHSGQSTRIMLRILGEMTDFDLRDAAFGEAMMALLYNYFAQQTGQALFSHMQRLDGRIINPKVLPEGVYAVRLHTEPIQAGQRESGVLMTLRLLYDVTRAEGSLGNRLSCLGYGQDEAILIEELTMGSGLTLISGQTGHGKSTLLKHIFESMVEESPEKSYLSVEDPPEYRIRGVNQVYVLANDDSDAARAKAYSDALAGAMRSDPDCLMIGEIRFAEAAKAAITAALTGHGVWATIHAGDAFATVSRLAGLLGSDPDIALSQIAESAVLRGIIHQKLLPVLCPNCKEPLQKSRSERAKRIRALLPRLKLPQTKKLAIRKGCPHCQGRGTIALTVVSEIVVFTDELLRILREEGPAKAKEAWLAQGGKTALAMAREKIAQGLCDPLDAVKRLGLARF